MIYFWNSRFDVFCDHSEFLFISSSKRNPLGKTCSSSFLTFCCSSRIGSISFIYKKPYTLFILGLLMNMAMKECVNKKGQCDRAAISARLLVDTPRFKDHKIYLIKLINKVHWMPLGKSL